MDLTVLFQKAQLLLSHSMSFTETLDASLLSQTLSSPKDGCQQKSRLN